MKTPALPPLHTSSMHTAFNDGTSEQVSSSYDEPIESKESEYNSPQEVLKNININNNNTETTKTNAIPMQQQFTMPQSSMVYDTSYDQQHTDRVEEQHDETYNRHLDEQSYEEHTKIYRDNNNEVSASSSAALATSSVVPLQTSIKEKIIPNVLSIAQKLLPTVMKRLDQHEDRLLEHNTRSIDYEADDFEGICSPLGSPMSSPQMTMSTSNVGNFKTTGETESDYHRNNDSLLQSSMMGRAKVDEDTIDEVDDMERGESIEILDEEDPTKYLPQSAALLVSALQGTKKQSNRNNPNLKDGRDYSLGNLSSLMDDEYAIHNNSNEEMNSQGEYSNSPRSTIRRSNTLEMQTKEEEADALLESIRKDDLCPRAPLQHQDDDDELAAAAVVSSSIAAAIGYDDDDDGSISGDMAQLSRSIAHLQRDLENLDFSHLYDDGFGDVGGGGGGSNLDVYYDSENTLLSRMKVWFSRGSIMEQKLMNSYVNPDNGGGTTTTNRGSMDSNGGRYSDNPVLVWSLSLMWAFVVLLLMHPKIAELMDGDDPGQLADIIEWLFG